LYISNNLAFKQIKKENLSANTIEQILLSSKYHEKYSHPHLLKLYKLHDEKAQISLIYENFTQKTLSNLLKKKKTLMERNAFIYFTQICLSIDYLHKKGLSSFNLTVLKIEFSHINLLINS